jgi:Na+/glutamate symporter
MRVLNTSRKLHDICISALKASEKSHMSLTLPFWQRLLITIAAMLVASWIAGLMWQSIFRIPLPSYVGGVVGGLAALPLWDFLKRIRPSSGA